MGIDWSLKNSETNNYLVQTCSYYSKFKFRLAGWLFSRAGTGAVGCACCQEAQLAITKPLLKQDLTKDCLLSDTWIFHNSKKYFWKVKTCCHTYKVVLTYWFWARSIFSGLAQNLYYIYGQQKTTSDLQSISFSSLAKTSPSYSHDFLLHWIPRNWI